MRPQVGFYHCFGCGEGGDVFTFLQKMDHVTFTEAVERLAGRIGFELHYEDGGQARRPRQPRPAARRQRGRRRVLRRAQLATPEADVGRDFLGERGFDAGGRPPVRRRVRARRAGTRSTDAPQGARASPSEELAAAGPRLAGRPRRCYDRFRGRLIWPIRDVTGQTVGFGARKLLDDDQGPKYLNTPETPIYHKARCSTGSTSPSATSRKQPAGRRRRGLHRRHGLPPRRRHDRGRHVRHGVRRRPHQGDPPRARRRHATVGTARSSSPSTAMRPARRRRMRAFAEEQRFAAQTFVAVAPDGLDPCDLRLAARRRCGARARRRASARCSSS